MECECLLTAASLVPKAKFSGKFGGFVESRSFIVKLGYHGLVLKAVVQYVHTNTGDVLKAADDNDSSAIENHKEKFQILLKLHGAAAYFHLPGLCSKIDACLSQSQKIDPSFSFHILEAVLQEGPAVPERLLGDVMVHVRSNLKNVD